MKWIYNFKQISRLLTLLLSLWLVWGVSVANGQVTVAEDDATNYTGWGGTNNQGGFGFGTWTFTTSGSGGSSGFFRGTSDREGRENIDTGGNAFGMFSNNGTGTGAFAMRAFDHNSDNELQVGDSFSFDFNFRFNGGRRGVDLWENADGTGFLANVEHAGSDALTFFPGESNPSNRETLVANIFNKATRLTFTWNGGTTDNLTIRAQSLADASYDEQVTITVGAAPKSFTLLFENTNVGGDFEPFFNNFEITSSGTQQITGSEGWRFLASPVATTYDAFINHMWTQGFTGSDYEGESGPDPAISNVRVLTNNNLDGGDQTQDSYESIGNITDALAPGQGFAMYVYQFDNYTGGGTGTGTFPKTLSATGTESTSTVSPAIITGADRFSIIGNPFASPVGWNAMNKTDMNATVRVYDYTVPGWILYNGTSGDLTDGIIAPLQGYLVEAESGSASISVPRSAKTSTVGAGFKNADDITELQLLATHDSGLRNTAWMSFAEDGSIDENSRDADVMYPLDFLPFANMYFELDGRMLDIKNMPLEISERVEYPLHIDAWTPSDDAENPGYVPMDGSVELTWPALNNLPQDWTITITDTQTGHVIDLRKDQSYSFELASQQLSDGFSLPYELAIKKAELITEKNGSRFIFAIEPTTTSSPIDGELPQVMALNQNYPNPFNPTTQISYDLPQSADVRLDVYNIQGQRVATLVNTAQSAGSHNVTFDAANLASGVYLYRLQAGATVLTKKMTLVK